jgi:hypothetical protein
MVDDRIASSQADEILQAMTGLEVEMVPQGWGVWIEDYPLEMS